MGKGHYYEFHNVENQKEHIKNLQIITTSKVFIKVIRTSKKDKDQNIEKTKITMSKTTSKFIIGLKPTFDVVIFFYAIGKIRTSKV